MAGDANAISAYLASIWPRLSYWLTSTASSLLYLTLPAAMLTGWLWARAGVLDRPAEHLPRLRRTAALGLTVGWLGGVPLMLTHLGVWLEPELSWTFVGVQLLTGLFGGIGYAALFGLLAAHLGRRRTGPAVAGPVTFALTAVGRRSLSAYLWQSVAMAPLLAAWGLGLGESLGSAAAAGVAVLIWLASVLGCVWLERRGHTGPAELALRRVTYGPLRARAPQLSRTG